ncbi:hypothetical protein Tco_0439918 [Tanacetum coccineum]
MTVLIGGFLHEVLIGFGFHPRMIGWIIECVTSTSFSININGSLHGYFKGKRGIHQGDPISPYLFTLVMEFLTIMLRQKVSDSDSFTYHHHCSDLNIINLCFADDLFLFAHGDVNSARVIMEALDEFKYAFGLVPSLPKSTAYFCNVLNYVMLDILNVLPFEEGKLPVKYLGVPLVSSRLIYRDCKELVENFKSKINDWKNKFPSFVGRVQLMQSVLASMHIYWASVFIIPSRTLLDLEQLMRSNFWDILLCGNMSWGWRRILQVRPLIRQFIWYRLGDGNMVSAWFDRWCLLSPLSDLVTPRDIHRASFDMSTKVHDVIINGNWKWPNDWLVKYPPLYTIPVPSLVPNSLDRLIWKSINDVDSGFSVATVWECIRPRGEEIDWYDLVWFSHNIPRHAIHLWLVIKRKLKTQDKLRQWDSHLQVFTGVPNMPSSLDLIVDILKPISQKRSARNVIVKLVFAASCYFIWQERNNRLFKNQKRSEDQVIEVIKSTVRLKLLSCKFKKTKKRCLAFDCKVFGRGYVFGSVRRVECQASVVLFFPSPGFFPWGFSWEGFLRRQSQMASYTPSLQLLVPSCFVIFDLEPLSLSFDFISKNLLDRVSSTQGRSSNIDVLDLPCLLVLITGTSQSRQHGKSESDSYYLSD